MSQFYTSMRFPGPSQGGRESSDEKLRQNFHLPLKKTRRKFHTLPNGHGISTKDPVWVIHGQRKVKYAFSEFLLLLENGDKKPGSDPNHFMDSLYRAILLCFREK